MSVDKEIERINWIVKEILRKLELKVFYSEEDESWIAVVDNSDTLKHVSAIGSGPIDAIAELQFVVIEAIDLTLKDGFQIDIKE